MACANGEIINAVLAPNKEPSLLYADLLKAANGDQHKAMMAYLNTQSPAFKEWFGDSKAVDKNGEPAVFWTGANQSVDIMPSTGRFEEDIVFGGPQEFVGRVSGGRTMTPFFVRANRLLDTNAKLLGSTRMKVADEGNEVAKQGVNPNFYKEKDMYDAILGYDHLQTEDDGKSIVVLDQTNIKHVLNSGRFTSTGTLTDELTEDEQLAIEILGEVTEEQIHDSKLEPLKKLLENQRKALERRINSLKQGMKRLNKVDAAKRQKAIDDLTVLVNKLRTSDTKLAFIELVEYSKAELEKLDDFLTNRFDVNNPAHDALLIDIGKQLATFGGLRVPEFAVKNSALASAITDINAKYNSVADALPGKIEEYMVNFIAKNSSNKDMKEVEDIKRYLREGKDIDFVSAWFGDTSSSADTILALVDKLRKQKLEEIQEANRNFTSRVKAAGRKLLAAGVTDFKWMLKFDENGKFTGRIIEKISDKYKEARKALYDAIKDADGETLQYIKKPLKDMTEEEKQFNKDLAKKKRAIGKFLRPEQWSKQEKKFVEGDNHKYSDEFLQARSQHEMLVKGKYGKEWAKKPGVTDAQYKAYVDKYYSPPVETWVMKTVEKARATAGADPFSGVFDDGDLDEDVDEYVYDSWFDDDYERPEYEETGEVEAVVRRFARPEYVEVLDHWNSEEYDNIMNATTAEGKAKKEFYEFYVKEFGKLMDKLPIDTAHSMQGKVFRTRDESLKQATEQGVGWFRLLLKSLKKLVTPDIITSGRILDENGNAVQDVGMFYVGDTYNEKKMERYKERLAELGTDMSPEAVIERKKIKRGMEIEEGKVRVEELNLDLVDSLIQGGAMAEYYDTMKSIESTMLLAKEMLTRKNYFKLDNKGEIAMDKDGNPEYKQGKDVNTIRRFENYLSMIYYSSNASNNTKIGQLAGSFQKWTSMKFQGLNPFSAINNAVTAEINQRIEARGARFYNKEHYSRAGDIFLKHLASDAWLSNRFKKHGKYDEVKPNNKVDAMVEYFNFLQRGADANYSVNKQRTGAEYAKSMDWLYLGIEIGEYQAQVRSGIAKMLATEVKLDDGTVTNVWDAHDFVNGELVLKTGSDFTKKDKYKLTNEIKNMNKFIHGNYDPQDKVAIQQYWLGELALQFKKWMFNSVRNRFGGIYYDEGLGMETEGRYKAYLRMFAGLKEFGIKSYKDVYQGLSAMDQAHMQKNIAEIGYFVSAVALYILFDMLHGAIPEDDKTFRAAVNFLKKQADRTRGEITFWSPMQVYSSLKNPVAGLRIIAQAGTFLGVAAKVPFNYAIGEGEKNFYDRGVNKGELKLYKATKDMIPVLQLGSQWEQLYVSGNFFIK